MPTASFRVTEKQAHAIRRAARLKRQTVSEYMRDAVFPARPATPPRTPKMIIRKHPVSGLSYNVALGQPDYTLDQLKEMLVDFP